MTETKKREYDRIPCPICGHLINRWDLKEHTFAERWVLNRIQNEHPEWKEENGVCTKCWEYYRDLPPRTGALN